MALWYHTVGTPTGWELSVVRIPARKGRSTISLPLSFPLPLTYLETAFSSYTKAAGRPYIATASCASNHDGLGDASKRHPQWFMFVNTPSFVNRSTISHLFVFSGFVTSVPLIVLTMVEHQLYLLHRRWRSRRYSKGVGRQHPARSLQTSPAATVGGAAEAGLGLECGAGAGGSASLSSLIKRFDAWWILLIMGVSVQAEGLQECGLRRLGSPVMLLFSHVSTLDAMIILSTFPQAFCAVVKVRILLWASDRIVAERGSQGAWVARGGEGASLCFL